MIIIFDYIKTDLWLLAPFISSQIEQGKGASNTLGNNWSRIHKRLALSRRYYPMSIRVKIILFGTG